ncbi:MAG TPA: hypothetical protein VHY48_13690 [Acidobacteriaceae bacterium]|jgi:hypothetical protein|nr:hypothetical protein [Acidobacteriaceae bacterium]
MNHRRADIHAPTRREFLAMSMAASAVAILPFSLSAQEPTGPVRGNLSIDASTALYTLPHNFTGLSYESAQVANPSFFSASNKTLIALFRKLSPQGVLRLGGGSSEYTTYSEQPPTTPPSFETFGPDTSKTVKSGTITSALALRNLRAFLDAAGWSCLYGLNLGQGTKANAVAEAEAAHRILGPRLLALQIGNEPDSFRNRFRPPTYGPQDFLREWLDFHAAILARIPHARFAGPDISNKLSFLTAFAQEATKHPDIVLLTGHYYAMGPAGSPGATLDNLLSADPRHATLKSRDVPVIQAAMQTAHLPFRISEMNSCWNGGEPGVSNTFASALWCADAMLRFASLGFSGVNLHGGGNGIYSPIVGSPITGFSRRPEFFGMMLAQHFAGATLLRTKLQCDSDRVTAYAARRPGTERRANLIAVINKTTSSMSLTLEDQLLEGHPWHALQLSAPSLDSQTDPTFAPANIRPSNNGLLDIPPHSALLLTG